MKKLLIILIISVLLSACKKESASSSLGTEDLSVSATIKLLTSKEWWKTPSENVPYSPYVLEFSTADSHTGISGGSVAFGQLSSVGHGIGEGSTDTFNIYIANGTTHLTITDDIAAVSLTGFSTDYQVTAISSAGFTLVSNQSTSTAPSFPKSTISYVASQY